MNDQQKKALAMEVKTPRGRLFSLFLEELATQNLRLAATCTSADEAFAFTSRAKGQLDAMTELQTLANTPIPTQEPNGGTEEY